MVELLILQRQWHKSKAGKKNILVFLGDSRKYLYATMGGIIIQSPLPLEIPKWSTPPACFRNSKPKHLSPPPHALGILVQGIPAPLIKINSIYLIEYLFNWIWTVESLLINRFICN